MEFDFRAKFNICKVQYRTTNMTEDVIDDLLY